MALGPSVLQMLTSGGKDGNQDQYKQTQEMTQSPRGYQSPNIGLLDPALMDMLIRNVQSFSGAGMPGGGNMPGYLGDILDMLGGDAGGLIDAYKTGSAKEKGRSPERGKRTRS